MMKMGERASHTSYVLFMNIKVNLKFTFYNQKINKALFNQKTS